MDKKTFEELVEETMGLNGHHQTNGHDLEMDPEGGLEFTDEMDHEILSHRDAHFGGDFSIMLDYYHEDGIGCHPDFDIDRITYLKEVEEGLKENLAALVLTVQEAENVAKARIAYTKLKEVYDQESDEVTRLIADLMLCEDEEPVELIEAIVALKERIAPDLLAIVKRDACYDALSPGYGLAPALAIHCLGEMTFEEAIIPIFERFGTQMLFDEEVLLEALQKIGAPAKAFLLDILKSRPITSDNIHAAFALTSFAPDAEIAMTAYKELQDGEVREKPLLSTYLLCTCDALHQTPYKEGFIAMGQDPLMPKMLRTEIEQIVRGWRKSV